MEEGDWRRVAWIASYTTGSLVKPPVCSRRSHPHRPHGNEPARIGIAVGVGAYE